MEALVFYLFMHLTAHIVFLLLFPDIIN